ncbi:pilus assembly PilX family protein [Pseudomonas sp. CGJS7]|uniref:pilus assembly PilX family protein n=1 Tax=Pseudomonas sp. CGJS7 TaxID=3109348 RepID=UPI0030092C19
MNIHRNRRTLAAGGGRRSGQRGAVLYVALIMLVLLALIGITALQVTGLQERMTSSYRSASLAFQNAEGLVRQNEVELAMQVKSGGEYPLDLDEAICSFDGFDPSAWAKTLKYADPLPATRKLSYRRRIDECVTAGGPIGSGKEPLSENTNLIFQVTAYAVDRGSNPGSDSVIDTISVP